MLGPKPQLADLETLELKLDEAILQETPPLEKGQGLLKLPLAAADLTEHVARLGITGADFHGKLQVVSGLVELA